MSGVVATCQSCQYQQTAQAGVQRCQRCGEVGTLTVPYLGDGADTFRRTRLSLEQIRERCDLPGGHRDRVVLATSLWSDYMVLTPWRLLRVEDTPSGQPRVVVRLATDPHQPEQILPLGEQRLYGLAPEGV